ncbi:MAG TPA: hypothetical protein VN369_08315 [Terriglobales bacterium]|nr:hypothetical protein [Terriglobales bacterium]
MLDNLKKLCAARGVTGDETEVAELVKELAGPYADDIRQDVLGNVIAFKKGESGGKKVMACAHMDEVGFYINFITDEGMLKFTAEGMDRRVVNGRRVLIGKDRIPGVIGTKPVHLQSEADKGTAPDVKQLLIDIGAKDKADAEKYVQIGDTAVFDSEFVEFGDGRIKARALDDRAGCCALLEAMKKRPAYDTYYVFTVLEESGSHGAHVAAQCIMPDYGVVVETTSCADFLEEREWNRSTILGGGAVVYLMESSAYYPRETVEKITSTADVNKIPWQYKTVTVGGTDAGSVQRSGFGAEVMTIATPCRNLHSGACTMSRSDFEATCALLAALLDTKF